MNNTRFTRLRKKICEEKKSMINVAFNLFDEDKDGFIDYQELKSALKALGFPTKKAEVLKTLETYDLEAQKYLSSDDFRTVGMAAWQDNVRQTALESHAALGRMERSLANSHRVAIETEEVGTEVMSELEQQREALLRSRQRLENTNTVLDQSRSTLRKMGFNVITNKLILILIIIMEVAILGCVVYLKFFR